jgi:hypothetical protein
VWPTALVGEVGSGAIFSDTAAASRLSALEQIRNEAADFCSFDHWTARRAQWSTT